MAPDSNADDSPPTLRQGLFLLSVITVLVIFAGVLPIEQMMIVTVGTQTEGRVVEHRVTSFGLRYATKAVYRFALDDGREITGKSSFDASPLPPVGSAVQVRYLPFWPEVSSYDNASWKHWGFWGVSVFFLVLAWIWGALLRKVLKLAARHRS